MLATQQNGYPCSPHCAGYLKELEQRKVIERLRAALKGLVEAPHEPNTLCGGAKFMEAERIAREALKLNEQTGDGK